MHNVIIDGITYVPKTSQPETEMPEGYLSPHFQRQEFACNHCGQLGHEVPKELLDLLEDVRSHFGDAPVVINSAYRCPTHNANVGGALNSYHTRAQACDIVVSGVPASNVYAYLDQTDPGKWGIGKHQTFVHVDVRGFSARW